MGLLEELLQKAQGGAKVAGKVGGDFAKGYTSGPQDAAASEFGTPQGLGNFLANGTPAGEATKGLGAILGLAPKIGKEAKPTANFLTKLGEAIKSDIGKVVAPDASKSLQGAQHTANIQDALRRNNVDNYKQIGPAATKLYDNIINPELSTKPQLLKIDDVTNHIVDSMKAMEPGIDSTEAKRAASGVINNMYDIARNKGGNTEVIPTHIDTPSLFNIKQKLNDTNAVNDYFNGNGVKNIGDLATVAARNSLGNIIGAAHPAIAQATHDYGLLKDAVPSLFNAMKGGRDISMSLPVKIAGQNIGVGIPSFLGGPMRDIAGGGLRTAGKIADTPLGKVLGIGGLVGAGIAGDKAVEAYNKSSQSNAQDNTGGNQNGEGGISANHTGSVSDGSKNVNRYQIANDPVKTGQLMQTQDFTDQTNKYIKQIADAKASGDVVTAARLQGEQAALENSFNSQKPLRDLYNDPVRGVGNVMAVGNEAYSSIQKADPGFFNALNGGYDKLLSSSNKNYSKMGGYLAYVSNATGIDFTKYKTKDALTGALDSAMEIMKTNWETAQKQYSGNSQGNIPSFLRKTAPTQAPVPKVSYPPGGFGSVGNNPDLTSSDQLNNILSPGQ